MLRYIATARGILCPILALSLSACTYLIPADQNTPRHNIVNGQRHRPTRNTIEDKTSQAPVDPMAPVSAVPVVPVAVNSLPPQPAEPVRPTPVQTAAVVPSLAPEPKLRQPETASVSGERRSPSENTVLVAQADTSLRNVPERPPLGGKDGVAARLGDTRRDLEDARTGNDSAQQQLMRDVAAEPPAFTEERRTLGAPTQTPPATPAPAVVPAQPQASVIAPPPMIQLPPPLPKPMQAASAQPVAGSLPPIQLRPPVSAEAPVAHPPIQTAAAPKDFDPMQTVAQALPSGLPPIRLTPPPRVASQVMTEQGYGASR